MGKGNQFVSIIMPAYNCEKFVVKAIESILNQSHTNFELLIADDCSTDKTKEIIDSYNDRRIRRYHNNQNQGYLKASNLLMEKCEGDFITFQDADDWSREDRLEILLNAFQEDKELACVGSFVKRVDENDVVLSEIKFKTDDIDIKNDLPVIFNCVGSSLMIKKEVVSKVGFYHLYFDRAGSEDLYWFGLMVTQFKSINIVDFLYFYRSTTGSVSNEISKSIRKLGSKDMATEALSHYIKYNDELFTHKFKLKGAELYVYGKYNCWNHEYRKGIAMLLKSLVFYPVRFREVISLLRIYLPKVFVL